MKVNQPPTLETALKELQILHTTFEQSPYGIAVISGRDFAFRLANNAYCKITSRASTEVIGRPYHALWPARDHFLSQERILHILEQDETVHFSRVNLLCPDGELRYVSVSISRIQWEGETGVLLVLREIGYWGQPYPRLTSEHSEAQRLSEELSATVTAMTEAVIIFNIEGQAIRANPAALEVFGVDPVGMDQQELLDLLAIRRPDGTPLPVEGLPSERARLGETIKGEHLLFTDKDNQESVFLVSASPLAFGEQTVGVVNVWHDVTDRERLLDQLEIEQSRLRTIIENAPEAILVTDEEGRLVEANPAARRILVRPLPFEQDYEQLAELQICHATGEPYNPRFLPFICSALDGSRHNNVDLLVILPDGQRRNILASTAPIVDRKGNLNGSVAILQDITLRKRTEDELRQQARRSEMLASLSQAFAEAGLKYRELLDTIVREVGAGFGDMCTIHMISPDNQATTLAAFYHPDKLVQREVQANLQEIYFPTTAESGESGVITKAVRLMDVSSYELEENLPTAYHPLLNFLTIQNCLIVPLRAHGRIIGCLGMLRSEIGARFNMEDEFFYQDLADRAALALEDARLFEEETRRVRELNALNTATTALLSTIDLETLLVQILDAAQLAIPAAEQGTLYLLAPDTGSLEIRAMIGFRDPRIHKVTSYHIQSHAARAVHEKRSLMFHNIEQEFIPGGSQMDGQSLVRSAIIAPLMQSNKVLGALSLTGSRPRLFRESDLRLLDSFAATATAALHNATLYAEVQRLATTDTLTEQYNRRRFFELGEMEMHRYRRFHNPLSAIMLDLDNFKEINDTHGHAVGDFVLFTVARRIRNSVRVVDILGRYGGDEFAILLPDADQNEAREIAERIRQAIIGEPIHISGGELEVSISLGIAQAADEEESLSSLLGRADSALYNAKQQGRNCVAEF